MHPELRAVLAIALLWLLPGVCILAASGEYRRWRGLQAWAMATALGIAFYPVVFHLLRAITPSVRLGSGALWASAGLASIGLLWRCRGEPLQSFRVHGSEWLGVFVVLLTLATRFWVAHTHPYPAWSDSLHHVLITQLTAEQGRLADDMMPFFPIPLAQYHLGLYALAAPVQWLAQVPAHTALLWTAQALNGLCGLGIYLVLDRLVGRLAAVVGAVTVGLLSHQPAFYVNWGRFTQLAGQTLLPMAWVAVWDALQRWCEPAPRDASSIRSGTAVAALLGGAIFLFHYRAAAFFGLLGVLAFAFVWWRARHDHGGRRVLVGTALLSLFALLVAGPSLWEALRQHVGAHLLAMIDRGSPFLTGADEKLGISPVYFHFTWRHVPLFAARPALFWLAAASALLVVVRRHSVGILILLWTIGLYALGMTYVLGLPALNITNLGAVLMMLYLPMALVIGIAAGELVAILGVPKTPRVRAVAIAGVLVVSVLGAFRRIGDLEPHRFFLSEDDLRAMAWIRENTPPKAMFAVNRFFWLPHFPHATGGGQWIPYLTGRSIVPGPMLSGLAPRYLPWSRGISTMLTELEEDPCASWGLFRHGIRYIYIDRSGSIGGPGLSASFIAGSRMADVVYEDGDVSILQIATDLPPMCLLEAHSEGSSSSLMSPWPSR